MDDPNSSFTQLFGVIRYDQAICSKIISIANSTYYSRGASVGSIERAMVMVGLEEIKRIIMCLVFVKGITAYWRLEQDDIAAIWGHSLIVAHAAKTLSARMTSEEQNKTFAVSILHDIGKVIFYTYGDRYRKIANEARLGARDICEFERAEFGIDHQEVGHCMSMKWGFPEEFSSVILGHHSPHDGKVPLIDIVRDADAFASGREDAIPEGEKEALQLHKESIEAEPSASGSSSAYRGLRRFARRRTRKDLLAGALGSFQGTPFTLLMAVFEGTMSRRQGDVPQTFRGPQFTTGPLGKRHPWPQLEAEKHEQERVTTPLAEMVGLYITIILIAIWNHICSAST
ncbi:MAG: HDOD domain-containing protein, partial [Syntrophorhabdales bacterium]